MRIRGIVFVISSLLFWGAYVHSENTKPNFSGIWTLDKEKSDLGAQGGSRGRRAGSGRMGVPGISIPGLGGPGMRGPRMGGGRGSPGSRGPDMGGRSPTGTGEINWPTMVQVPESLVIEHADPQLLVRTKTKMEDTEQVRELKYTTDGKLTTNEGPRGNSMQSKTHWKGDHLITKSNFETPSGKMALTEVRSLFTDGKIMTVEVKSSSGPREWSQKLVYKKG